MTSSRRHRATSPRRILARGVVAGALLVAVDASHAQAEDEATAARAERLFHEGEELFDARSFTEACAKFAASHDLDPKLGTLLNLAFCHESEGRTARARSEFDEALMWAVQKGQKDREQFAREHLAALEKRLSYVVLEAPAAESEGLDVRVDGQLTPRSRWGAPLVVDPGLHMLTATAPMKEPQPILFYVEPGPATRTLRIPTLLDDPVAAAKVARHAPLPPPIVLVPQLTPGARARRTGGLIALGVGAVGIGLGGFFAARAVSLAGDVRSACGASGCTAEALTLDHEGATYTAAAGAALGVGVLGLGVGTWLVLSSTTASSTRNVVRTSVAPIVTRDGVGVGVAGGF